MRVLLGVTGGIAAYKAVEVVRRLRESGHEVRCALTRGGASFLRPLTLEVLSGNPVYGEEYLSAGVAGEERHITAAAWADVLLIAPATAHCLARLAVGLADDFLTTTALAFDGRWILAPAMHPVMWAKPSVQEHVATLRARGVFFVGPIEGALASGEVGWGRMAEPADIVAAVGGEDLAKRAKWAGRMVLVTAGGTQEPVDPVRFLGNRSSGRMGFALASAASRRGARVLLVAGPVSLATPQGVERHDVTTALEMQAAVERSAPGADLIIMAAAVADFRVSAPAASKIKRGDGKRTVELEPNPDILASLAEIAPRAVRVGFAAETEELPENAAAKLAAKRCHFVVANDVSRADIGFDSPHNEVTVWRAGGDPVFIPRRDKEALAADLLDLFEAALEARETAGEPSR